MRSWGWAIFGITEGSLQRTRVGVEAKHAWQGLAFCGKGLELSCIQTENCGGRWTEQREKHALVGCGQTMPQVPSL